MAAVETLFSGVLPFFHVAQEKSFRRAGERLGVTSAAVSKAVLRLEEDLGVKLLVRTSRSVTLTPEGALFAARCGEAIASLRAGRELLLEAQRQPTGEVKVTVPFILGRLVAKNLTPLAVRYPRLAFRVTTTDRLVSLVDESVDVAVRIGTLDDSSLIARPLRGSRWVTVASPGYAARRGVPATPEALGDHVCCQFVAPDGRPRDWTFADPKSRAATSVKVKARLLVDQGELLLEAAESGLGLCQVLDFMVGEHLAAGRLVEVLGAFRAEGPPITALTLPERSRAPAVRALVDHLADAFRRVEAPARA